MAELLIEVNDLKVEYGLRTVLDIEHFSLYAGEKLGLVGENGAGKSTFLNILSGDLKPDSGNVRVMGAVSHIRQMGLTADLAPDAATRSLFRAPEARETLSGGEKTRLRIAGAYSEAAHILLADEPTTDLDADGIALLTDKLKNDSNAVILVSHDRQLLDDVCTSVAELKNGHLTLFPGNYSDYLNERMRRREFQQFEYDRYRKEKARLSQVIQGVKESASQKHHLPDRMGISEARLHRRSATEVEEKLHKTRKAIESRLMQLEEKERPEDDPDIRMALGAFTPITSAKAVEIRGLTLAFPGKPLFEKAHAILKTGARTALTGSNGTGKTTLIRKIIENDDPHIRVSPGVRIGYFGQDHADVLDLERSILENVMYTAACDESTARTVLARLELRGDTVKKPCGVLSGGERAKVCLARLLTADINLLILDEPTNHIDLYTMEALEELLKNYSGTLLFTSHDRYFSAALAQRVWKIENNRLLQFEGGFDQIAEQAGKKTDSEAEKLEITRLELRLGEMAARLSKPLKGDDPEKLNSDYIELAREVNRRKRELEK